MKEQQRAYPRFQISRPVYVHADNGPMIRARSLDISVAGIGILCPERFAPGEVLNLRLLLGAPGALADTALKGAVRHHYFKDTGYAIGLEFIELAGEALTRISQFISFRQSLAPGPGFLRV